MIIPSYPNRTDPAAPLLGAYARIGELHLIARDGTGSMVIDLHPTVAAAAADPIDRAFVALGGLLAPSPVPPPDAPRFPTLEQLLADPEFAAAYAVIAAKLYAALIANHPRFAGATA